MAVALGQQPGPVLKTMTYLTDTLVFETSPSPVHWSDHLRRTIHKVDGNADVSADPRTPFL